MKKYTCAVRDVYFVTSGCRAKVSGKGIYIKWFFSDVLEIPAENIRKLILYKNGRIMRLEYNNGTKNNEAVDLAVTMRKSFISYTSSLGWTIEKQDKFIRKNNELE